MFWTECERLASEQPTSRPLIERFDEMLQSFKPGGGVICPATLASAMGTTEYHLRSICEALAEYGLFVKVQYAICPNMMCGMRVDQAEISEAIENEITPTCTACETPMVDEIEYELVFRIHPDRMAAMMQKHVTVFLSHSGVDEDFAKRLAGDLRVKWGIDVWVYEWEIGYGDVIPAKMEEGLRDSEAFLFLTTPDSLASPASGDERAYAVYRQWKERRKIDAAGTAGRPYPYIPVIYVRTPDEKMDLPPLTEIRRWVPIADDSYDTDIQVVVKAIEGKTDKPPLGPPKVSLS